MFNSTLATREEEIELPDVEVNPHTQVSSSPRIISCTKPFCIIFLSLSGCLLSGSPSILVLGRSTNRTRLSHDNFVHRYTRLSSSLNSSLFCRKMILRTNYQLCTQKPFQQIHFPNSQKVRSPGPGEALRGLPEKTPLRGQRLHALDTGIHLELL